MVLDQSDWSTTTKGNTLTVSDTNRPFTYIQLESIFRCACLRCGYSWWPRKTTEPVKCPRCRSKLWDKARKAR